MWIFLVDRWDRKAITFLSCFFLYNLSGVSRFLLLFTFLWSGFLSIWTNSLHSRMLVFRVFLLCSVRGEGGRRGYRLSLAVVKCFPCIECAIFHCTKSLTACFAFLSLQNQAKEPRSLETNRNSHSNTSLRWILKPPNKFYASLLAAMFDGDQHFFNSSKISRIFSNNVNPLWLNFNGNNPTFL